MGLGVDALVSRPSRRDLDPGSDPLTFSVMTPRDLAAVVDLERRAFSHPWSSEVFQRELRLSFSKIVIARWEQTVVGYLCRWLTEDVLEIQNVAVHPDWRRRSIGRRLVVGSLDEARMAGASRALLEVRRYNHSAIALYRALGFHETGLRRRYYADGEDALLMELRLDGDRP
jgi:ribosomal-protein-alanine N-acetyltransferase